ncbi:hypothetical protein GWK47_011480 [Chionoecetes opilio]|uniref:Uncharacterized protein n=1 Tax=Chionoecetes opilio TaxID=41210 RepID=A0A8J4XXE4_CHIOP|nr:hypothetical protein GWK47_011480 [Chionoecetes opilio]
MILDGPNIKSQSGDGVTQATLSTAQLLQYNSSIRRRVGSTTVRHNKDRETHCPSTWDSQSMQGLGKSDLIEMLFDLGLSISYDRVMAISTSMGNRVCEQYHRDEVVCPPNLREGLFTTAAVDNIDHNPSSTTSTDSFHGTGISLFQTPVCKIMGRTAGNTASLNSHLLPLHCQRSQSPTPVFVRWCYLGRILHSKG